MFPKRPDGRDTLQCILTPLRAEPMGEKEISTILTDSKEAMWEEMRGKRGRKHAGRERKCRTLGRQAEETKMSLNQS